MNSKRTPRSLIPFGHQQVEGNDSGLSIAHMGMGWYGSVDRGSLVFPPKKYTQSVVRRVHPPPRQLMVP